MNKLKNLFFLIIIPLLYLFIKRNKNYFSFGDWFGFKNSDSSFYIFKEAHKDQRFKVAWITKSNEIHDTLLQNGLTCFKANSIDGIIHQLKSWTFVSTVNSFDFYPLCLLTKKNYIQLGHGPPFKKYFKTKFNNYAKFKFMLRSKTIDNYSYYASPTKVFNEITKYQYSVNDSKILEIPPARCDYFSQSSKIDILNKLNLRIEQSYLIYLPTHRDEGKSINAITKNLKMIDKILDEFNGKYKVLFKPHFYDIPNFEKNFCNYKNILFDSNWNSDELMLVSSLLIGDYSGVVFDYYYLNKYEIGLCTDHDSYTKKHRDLYFKIEHIYPNLAKNEDELRQLLINFKENKLMKTDSSPFIWKNTNGLSFSRISWEKILKTL